MWLYNYNGVIYSDERRTPEVEPVILDESCTEYDHIPDGPGPGPSDLCIVAEKDGKLGVMLRCSEYSGHGDVLFRCAEEDFKYDTVKVFLSEGGGSAIVIGSYLGIYQCFLIEETADIEDSSFILGAKSSPLSMSPVLKDCLDNIPEIEEYIPYLNISAGKVESLARDQIFVFGSNREGEHRGGASKTAKEQFGAEWGIGKGRTGQSYALPTMDGDLDMLRQEIHDFMTYAASHPELEFVLTKVGCGASVWQEKDVRYIFSAQENWGAANILIPLEWSRQMPDDLEPQVESSIAGRHTFDEWIGNLAVLYAGRKYVELSFSEEGISILSDNADDLCRDLVNRFNLRREGIGKIEKLQSLYEDMCYIGSPEWYTQFLEHDIFRLCTDFEKGRTLNPSESICELVNYIVKNHPVTCASIYNPFAGIGALSSHNIGYTNQEPSSDYSLLSRLLEDIRHSGNRCLTGDFNTDWLAEGHDAIVCIPPIAYGKELSPYEPVFGAYYHDIIVRYRQTLKLLMHKLTQPCESLKLAVVFVGDDFLYSDEFERYRRVFCEDLGVLKYVMRFSDNSFTDMKTGGAILVFDYYQCSHSVSFVRKDFIDSLETFCETDDEDNRIFDWSPDEFTVPCSTLAENHYILVDEFYNYSRGGYICKEYGPDNFMSVPLRDLVSISEGERCDCKGKTALCTDWNDFSFLYHRVITCDTHRVKLQGKAAGYVTLHQPGSLFVSSLGMVFNTSDEPAAFFKNFCIDDGMTIIPDDTKVDPYYLIAALCDDVRGYRNGFSRMMEFLRKSYTPSFVKDLVKYVLNWRIPVPKDGLEGQRRIVESLKNWLKAAKEKTYDVIILGNIETQILEGRNLRISEKFAVYTPDSASRLWEHMKGGQVPDAIVIDDSFGYFNGFYFGVSEVLHRRSSIPVYVLDTTAGGVLATLQDSDRAYLNEGRIFGPDSISDLIDSMRRELDYRNSPENLVRKEYAAEFTAAKDVQKAIDFGRIDIAKEMETILVGCRNQNPSIAERSFNFFRNVRDGIFRALRNRQVLPDLDMGALASLLADKYYSDGKDDSRKYYMTGRLMPNNLSAGLQYLSSISNEAVHTGNGDKDAALAAVHILFQLLFWTQDKIGEGFFDRSHANEFYTDESGLDWEYKLEEPYPVMVAGDYKYVGKHIHLDARVAKDVHDGDLIKIYRPNNKDKDRPVTAEKKPFITEDIALYLYTKYFIKV